MMKTRLYIIGLSIAITAFVAANAILVFKEDSIVARNYYIEDHVRVAEGDYKRELEKEAVAVPTTSFSLTVNREDLKDVLVEQGDTVTNGQPIATLDTTDTDQQRAEWDARSGAYETELRDLNAVLSTLRTAKSRSGSTSSTSGSSTGRGNANDEIVDVTVNANVDVEISEDATYDSAMAAIEEKIAEVERELVVVDAQLTSTSEAPEFVSPIDGVVEKVEEYETQVIVHVTPNEATLVTFVEEKNWHEIELTQPVQAYSTHLAKFYAAETAGKGTVPVTDNRWKEIHGQFEEQPDLPLYEVQITPAETLTDLPFGANVNVTITIDEATGAMRLRDDWTIVRDLEYAEIYSISQQGTIGRIPVTIAFDMPETQSIIVNDGLVNGQVVIDDTFRRNNAPAFLPHPFELPSWESVKALGWRDYLAFLLHQYKDAPVEEPVE